MGTEAPGPLELREEIGEMVGCSQQEVAKLLPQMAELPKVVKPSAEHLCNPHFQLFLKYLDKYTHLCFNVFHGGRFDELQNHFKFKFRGGLQPDRSPAMRVIQICPLRNLFF